MVSPTTSARKTFSTSIFGPIAKAGTASLALKNHRAHWNLAATNEDLRAMLIISDSKTSVQVVHGLQEPCVFKVNPE